ncbi:MAG: hypothetical protein P8Z41_16665, partial [Anaerolineales bacterium]
MILVFGALTLTACKPEAAATERPPTPQQVEQLPPPLTPRSTLFESDLDDLSLFASGLIESERAALEGLEDCSTYRIDVALSQDLLHVDGRQEVDYTNREDVPLEEIYFRLYPNISGGAASVSDVLVVGTPVDPVYEKERSALRLPLPTPLHRRCDDFQFGIRVGAEAAAVTTERFGGNLQTSVGKRDFLRRSVAVDRRFSER